MHTDIIPVSKAPQQENLTRSTGATVVAFDRSDRNEGKEEYTAAIRMWCVDRSLSDVLRPDEIGALRALDRIDAQRKAIIIGLSHYYRKHERADVAPGVAVVIALLSDNEKGLATISQPTLAQLFGRSRSAIGDAQKRLKDDGLIGMTRGRYAGSFPIVPREVTRSYNHMTWLIEALNTQNGPVNLPAPPADCQSTGPTGGLKSINRPHLRIESLNQPVEDVSINRPDATQLHLDNSTTLNRTKAAAIGIATALASLPAAAAPPINPPAIVQPVKLTLAQMSDRMLDAGGRALANPAGAVGLLTFSELQRWLEDGCDFETDILQTIRAVCAKRLVQNKDPIGTWSYFSNPIANAKATRTRPMPAGAARVEYKPFDKQKSADDVWLDKEIAKAKREGLIP